jgi:hypothetical protein
MANDPNALTNMWMTNPTMFDPTQKSNQFSNFNDAPFPWPPTYNTGPAGGPVNAATGQPIQSFQQWQQANPGGTTLNATPAAPQAPQQATPIHGVGGLQPGQYDGANGLPAGNPMRFAMASQPNGMPQGWNQNSGNGGLFVTQPSQAYAPQQQAAPQAQAQASGPPNNWQAAINALANPGKVATPGATVPMATGTQPAGGVNQAWLQGIGGGQGMNQNFVSALRGIQGR